MNEEDSWTAEENVGTVRFSATGHTYTLTHPRHFTHRWRSREIVHVKSLRFSPRSDSLFQFLLETSFKFKFITINFRRVFMQMFSAYLIRRIQMKSTVCRRISIKLKATGRKLVGMSGDDITIILYLQGQSSTIIDIKDNFPKFVSRFFRVAQIVSKDQKSRFAWANSNNFHSDRSSLKSSVKLLLSWKRFDE